MFGDISRPSYWTGKKSSPLRLSKTGSTALRLAEVQQPKTTATLSLEISFLDFSAKVGQSDAPSSTIGSSFIFMTPPAALISSMAISVASRTEVSEIAVVPLSEWRTPILMVPPLAAAAGAVVFSAGFASAGLAGAVVATAAGAAGLAASVGLAAGVAAGAQAASSALPAVSLSAPWMKRRRGSRRRVTDVVSRSVTNGPLPRHRPRTDEPVTPDSRRPTLAGQRIDSVARFLPGTSRCRRGYGSGRRIPMDGPHRIPEPPFGTLHKSICSELWLPSAV